MLPDGLEPSAEFSGKQGLEAEGAAKCAALDAPKDTDDDALQMVSDVWLYLADGVKKAVLDVVRRAVLSE